MELDIGAGDQKARVMGLPGGERSLTIFSAVEYTNYVTDGRTDTGRQQRPLLRIASRGKTVKRMSYSDWGLFSNAGIFVPKTIRSLEHSFP